VPPESELTYARLSMIEPTGVSALVVPVTADSYTITVLSFYRSQQTYATNDGGITVVKHQPGVPHTTTSYRVENEKFPHLVWGLPLGDDVWLPEADDRLTTVAYPSAHPDIATEFKGLSAPASGITCMVNQETSRRVRSQ
jgi:hypothetical protein